MLNYYNNSNMTVAYNNIMISDIIQLFVNLKFHLFLFYLNVSQVYNNMNLHKYSQ